MLFPFVRFGKCPVCGGGGAEYSSVSTSDAQSDRSAATTRETAADADDDVDISTENGYPLKMFRGEVMCGMCIKKKLADEESLLHAEKHAATKRFLSAVGFKKEVS